MSEGFLYLDSSQPLDARVDDLLGRMTLDEKLAQIGCVWSTALVEDETFSEKKAAQYLAGGIGHITRIGSSTGLRPSESAAFANEIQRFLVERTRLKIPAIIHEESCAGFAARDATQFPQAIGLASTWEPELVEALGAVIREQMLAVGARQTLAPVLDVARDPRWGRTEETYGEDPYLASRIGVAYVRGVQGTDLSRGVAATGKHFLAYGFAEGGMNHAPVHVGARELREVFARPFAAAIRDAGLASVMNAYNEVDGLPCAGAREILDDLLRGELGFEGVVVADYYAVSLLASFHKVAADPGEAGQRALEAGLDVELPQIECYGGALRERVERGLVKTELIDRAVGRLLRLKFRLGLFERPYVDHGRAHEVYDTPAQRALARTIAEKSIVLLKNDGPLLPLDPSLRKLAVIGPCADDPRLLQGDYSYPAHTEIIYRRDLLAGRRVADILPAPDKTAFAPGPYYVPMVTVLDGVRRAASPRTEVISARGCEVTGDSTAGFDEARDAARAAGAAIVVVGGRSGLMPDCTSGEFRDASDLGLTGAQQKLVEEIVATGTPTVVVLVNGRVFALPWIAEHVAAIVEAWLPGEEGGNAVADVLFGRANPAGRLPISMPRAVGQVPVYYGHKAGGGRSQMLGDYSDGSTKPLFPFGHGLSYTRFEYANLEVSPSPMSPTGAVQIGIDVRNAGARDGEEVVQVYLRDLVATVTRPVKQLAGFKRVALKAGELRRIVFSVDMSQLAFHAADMRFIVEPGTVEVTIGASSADIRARASFEIEGAVREVSPREVVATAIEVLEPAAELPR